jgi:hypothetical protein
VAGLGTRAGAGTAADLAGADRAEWKRLRAELEERRQRRVERRLFRRDPEDFLKDLEIKLNRPRLPAQFFRVAGDGLPMGGSPAG